MDHIKPTSQVKGIAITQILKIAKREKISAEDAFALYLPNRTNLMKKYDFASTKSELIKKVGLKLGKAKKGETGKKTKSPKKTMKSERKAKKTEAKKRATAIKLEDGTNALFVEANQVYLRGKGKRLRTNAGIIYQQTKKRGMGVECGKVNIGGKEVESKGVQLKDGLGGCAVNADEIDLDDFKI